MAKISKKKYLKKKQTEESSLSFSLYEGESIPHHQNDVSWWVFIDLFH